MTKSTFACIALLSLFSLPGRAGDELRVSEADLKEAAISKPLPEYPVVARQLKITGKVELEVHVDESGQVADVKIVTGNAVLTRPTAKTISGWKFKPFQKDGKPVQAVAPLNFEFR
jgi:periplasmic protein TonB